MEWADGRISKNPEDGGHGVLHMKLDGRKMISIDINKPDLTFRPKVHEISVFDFEIQR
jgi:hypothetical protein